MTVWPLPSEYVVGNSVAWLSKDVKLVIQKAAASSSDAHRFWGFAQSGEGATPHAAHVTHRLDLHQTLRAAFQRLIYTIFHENFVPSKFHPPHVRFEPEITEACTWIEEIQIYVHRLDESTLDSLEAYSLDLNKDGSVCINIASCEAGLHALTSFSQLCFVHSDEGGSPYCPYLPVTVKDIPRFEHRGLSIDIARNRMSPKIVMQALEGMSLCKLNRLRLHAWDSQSWPIEIPALPELATKGSYHSSQIWKVKDLEDVQRFGLERGIEVYFDADMPGHTASIHHAYPELVVGYNIQPWEPYCLEPPSGQLKLDSADVRVFLDKLFDDLLPRVAKYSSHLQVGGEEINTKIYELEDTIKSSSVDHLRPLLQSFMDYAISHAVAHNLSPIVWEEAVLEWDLELPKSTIIQAWKSESSLPAIAAKGYRVLAGTHTHWYLDGGRGSWVDPDLSGRDSQVKPPFVDWNSPYKNWRMMYSYDPLRDVADEHKHLVLGGECMVWSETIDEANLHTILWPRVCAVAEVLWKGRGTVSEDVTRRLAEVRERLVAKGFAAEMVQMEWCLQNPCGALM